jgi:trimeric autotransporter adhesin
LVGIIAQEMQKIAPYTVNTFHDDETNMDYLNYDGNAVLYILINSIQEQQTEIDTLKKQLQEQNERLVRLEEKLK